MKTIFNIFDQNHQLSSFSYVYGVFAPNFHSNFIKFHPKMTFPSFFHETLLESLRDSHSPGQVFHFPDSKTTHLHFFHLCTAFWFQKFITNSQNGVQRSHFGLQSGHRRARPARPGATAGGPPTARAEASSRVLEEYCRRTRVVLTVVLR